MEAGVELFEPGAGHLYAGSAFHERQLFEIPEILEKPILGIGCLVASSRVVKLVETLFQCGDLNLD